MNGLSRKQYDTLMRPLNRDRIKKRSQGGKQLSYLESWDVRAHLIRVFGFCNFDIETLEQQLVGIREYQTTPKEGDPKPMVECMWFAKVRLIVRDGDGEELCRYAESAVGSTSGPANMIGEHHDNAIKTAASDALKRCAINLGTQFGLSLYDNGMTRDVVRGTLVFPEGTDEPETPPQTGENEDLTDEQRAVLEASLGATVVSEEPTDTPTEQERAYENRGDAPATARP